MQFTCRTCGAQRPAEDCVEDDAGRELMAALAGLHPDLARPLLHYLGFFRPPKQQLRWGRALRLLREALALSDDLAQLQAGLAEAERALDEKRAQGAFKALTNHNYLKRCVEGQPRGGALVMAPAQAARPTHAPQAKSVAALSNLEAMKR